MSNWVKDNYISLSKYKIRCVVMNYFLFRLAVFEDYPSFTLTIHGLDYGLDCKIAVLSRKVKSHCSLCGARRGLRLQQTSQSVLSIVCCYVRGALWLLLLLGLLVAVVSNTGCLLQLLVSTRPGHSSPHHATPHHVGSLSGRSYKHCI